MKHSILGASGSSRWLNCPGSVKACKDYPNTSSVFAQEGTCAHELAEICLNNGKAPQDYVDKRLSDAPDIIVDREMANYVEEYVNYVNAIPGEPYIEVRVDYSPWAIGGFGTSDAIVIDENAKIIHVIDLKYGKGVEVNAEWNTQGMLYALGAINEYDLEYDINGDWDVVIHIYQPRIGNIDEWPISVQSLIAWAENTVRPAANLCMTDDAPRVAGDKQCNWCQHKAKCPELQSHLEHVIGSEFDNLDLPTVETGMDFTNIMANKKLIEGWLKAIEGLIFEELEKGNKMSGFKLVKGKTSRKWSNPEEAEQYMRKKKMRVGEMFTKKLMTPPQAEKFLGKEKYAKVVEEGLIIKSDGKPALAVESDKRKALNMNINDDFESLE